VEGHVARDEGYRAGGMLSTVIEKLGQGFQISLCAAVGLLGGPNLLMAGKMVESTARV
jgi:hypothetical protein